MPCPQHGPRSTERLHGRPGHQQDPAIARQARPAATHRVPTPRPSATSCPRSRVPPVALLTESVPSPLAPPSGANLNPLTPTPSTHSRSADGAPKSAAPGGSQAKATPWAGKAGWNPMRLELYDQEMPMSFAAGASLRRAELAAVILKAAAGLAVGPACRVASGRAARAPRGRPLRNDVVGFAQEDGLWGEAALCLRQDCHTRLGSKGRWTTRRVAGREKVWGHWRVEGVL